METCKLPDYAIVNQSSGKSSKFAIPDKYNSPLKTLSRNEQEVLPHYSCNLLVTGNVECRVRLCDATIDKFTRLFLVLRGPAVYLYRRDPSHKSWLRSSKNTTPIAKFSLEGADINTQKYMPRFEFYISITLPNTKGTMILSTSKRCKHEKWIDALEAGKSVAGDIDNRVEEKSTYSALARSHLRNNTTFPQGSTESWDKDRPYISVHW